VSGVARTPIAREARRLAHRALARVPRRAHGHLAGLRIVGGGPGYRRGDYEPALSEALLRLARPGFTCADVGAHHGYFSLLLARTVGESGRVVAFEASPANVRVLRRNLALNRLLGRVEVVEAVVSDDGRDTREIWPGRAGTSSEWTLSREFAAREDEQPIARSPLVVPATTLDAAFSHRSLDLLKVDVEGAEGLVLAGARRLLAEQRPIVVLEFHREVGWPAIEILQGAGYDFELPDGSPLPALRSPEDVPYHLVARAATPHQ
jgi:FkbM family methyltransferase